MRSPPDLQPSPSSTAPVSPTPKREHRLPLSRESATSQIDRPSVAVPLSPTSLPSPEPFDDDLRDGNAGGDGDGHDGHSRAEDDEFEALAHDLTAMGIQNAAHHYEEPVQAAAPPHVDAVPRPPSPEYTSNGMPSLLSRWIAQQRTQKLYVVTRGFRTGIFPTWPMTSSQVSGFPKNDHQSFPIAHGVDAWELWVTRCLSGTVFGEVSHESLVGFVVNGAPPARGQPDIIPQATSLSLTPSMYGPTAFLPVYGNGQPTAVTTTAFYVPPGAQHQPTQASQSSNYTAHVQPSWNTTHPPPPVAMSHPLPPPPPATSYSPPQPPATSYPPPPPAGTPVSYFHPVYTHGNGPRLTPAAPAQYHPRTNGLSAAPRTNGAFTYRNA